MHIRVFVTPSSMNSMSVGAQCILRVRSKFSCVRSSQDLCALTHAHSLEGTVLIMTPLLSSSPSSFSPLFPTTPTFQSCNCFHSLIPSSFPFFFLPPRNPLLFPSSHVPHSGFFSFLSTFSKSFSCPSRSS